MKQLSHALTTGIAHYRVTLRTPVDVIEYAYADVAFHLPATARPPGRPPAVHPLVHAQPQPPITA